MKYNGVTCPACGEDFTADSDVVVCPECGTPHHRACYEKNGNCINVEKHSEDFAWINPNVPEKVETIKPTKNIEITKVTKENMPKNGVIGEMNFDQRGNAQPTYREIRGNEKIGDFTVDEYSKVIGQNVPKFMPRFLMLDKTKKKATWNWAAFIFGPFYLAYRKMYKWAAIALLLVFIIPLICLNEVSDYYRETSDMYRKTLTADAYKTTEEMETAISDLEANLPTQPRAVVVANYIEIVVDVLCGVFANYLYLDHCTKLLEKSKKIDDEEKRFKYLEKKGGRSIFSVIGFIFVFYFFIFVIATVYYTLDTDLATFLRKFI